MIQSDVFRASGRSGVAATLRLFARDRFFRPILTLRAYRALHATAIGPVARPVLWLLHRWFCGAAGMDLPIRSAIGSGLSVPHGWGLVVNEHAQIGCNVTLFHGVTIGQADAIAADGTRTTRVPVIENDVWIGPHAAVLGGVRVGAGSRILAGTIIVADVPPATMMAGNPAQVVRHDCAPDVLNRAVVTTR